MILKYLFAADYTDGTTFYQNAEDVSGIDPKRSAFYDVRHEDLVRFSLIGDGKVYSVDLFTGEFEINGNKFILHGDDVVEEHKKEVLFFRKHRHDFNINMEEMDHRVTYILGWSANNKEYKIEFS